MLLAPPPTPGPFPPSFPPQEPASAGDWVWSVLANVWSFLTSGAGALAALAAIVTAVIAVIALRSTSADSRERSRPVVYAWFRQAEHNDRAFDFVVRNYGPSAAHDVTLRFAPDFTAEQKADRLVEIIAERWERTLPVLPGRSQTCPQSPGAGLVAPPSPFVSPPAESSLSEVRTIGRAAVPRAIRLPSIRTS